MLDVHEQELLVLLLVVQAELDEARDVGSQGACQQAIHRLVHVSAVFGHLADAGPRDDSTARSGIPGADTFVVGVEQVRVGGMERPVSAQLRLEEEGLEEPRSVGTVPFCGADVGHGLDRLILRGEGGGQGLGHVAHLAVARRQPGGLRSRRDQVTHGFPVSSVHSVGGGCHFESLGARAGAIFSG